jgi:transposase InsO family protein
MKLHGNAALTLKKRRLLVSRVLGEGWSIQRSAAETGISARRAGEWVRRFKAEGDAGLLDRSSAPKRVHNRTPEDRVQVIAALRRLRMTGAEIAEVLGMPHTTVSGILTQIGMGRLGRLGLEPAERYERKRPGELVHIDIKKLGRIQGGAGKRARESQRQHYTPRRKDAEGHDRGTVGWEYVHVAVDDATRLAYIEVLGDEKATTAVGFLGRAIRFFRSYGIKVERLLTDNGAAYRSKTHALACRILSIRHLRTRPYRPQTNGKAERFIRTMLNGWAYGAIYGSSAERTAALDGWLWRYNHQRPHGSLGRKPPAARLTELNNLLGSYI